ncbi:MAG: G1 family glutamic endopeptidase [Paracraurococcus sp.]
MEALSRLLLPRRTLLAGAGAAALAGALPRRAAAAAPRVAVRLEREIGFWLLEEGQKGFYRVAWAGPPADFDALRADAAQLARYGLEPRPTGGGAELAAWEVRAAAWRFAAPEWATREASRASHAPIPEPRVRDYRRAPTRVPGENWGGAYVRAIEGTRLSGIAAQWTVPASLPRRPPARSQAGDAAADDFRCSHWIGLDGCDPNSRSLPQCGTLRAFGDGAAEERGLWWQWWIAGGAHQSGNLIEFAAEGSDPGRWQGIGAGDRVEARITLPNPADRRTVRFWFRVDPAPRFAEPPIFLAFDVTLDATRTGQREFAIDVEGRVAEWVIERPMRPTEVMRKEGGRVDEWLYGLPVFDSVTFEACRTWLEDGSAGPDLRRARSLRITDWSVRSDHGAVVARVEPPYPAPLEPSRVTILYTGPR